MMGIKGQIPALCGEFWIFPIKTILLAEFFNPFCCLSCCHIQTGIFADVNPWLWIMQVIWINLVYNNLEEQRKNIMILLAIFGQIRSLCWITSKQFLRKISQKLGSMIQSKIPIWNICKTFSSWGDYLASGVKYWEPKKVLCGWEAIGGLYLRTNFA